MGDLAIYDEKKMSLSSARFIMDTLNHKKIAETPSYEAIKQIGLCTVYQAEAFKITSEITQIDKNEIKELILSRFKRLSVNELYYAFKLERFLAYDDKTDHYNRFDAMFVSQVLTKYVKWKQKVRIDRNLPIANPKPKIDVSEQEKRDIIHKGVLDCYDHYKETYMIPDMKSYVYDVLYDLGALPTSKEEKIKIYNEAIDIIKMDVQVNKTIKGRSEVQRILKQLEEKKSSIAILQAKKLSISKYFRKINRKELIELLKNL